MTREADGTPTTESLRVLPNDGVYAGFSADRLDWCATGARGFGLVYGSGAIPFGGFGSGAGSVVVGGLAPAAAGASIAAASPLQSSGQARRPTCGR